MGVSPCLYRRARVIGRHGPQIAGAIDRNSSYRRGSSPVDPNLMSLRVPAVIKYSHEGRPKQRMTSRLKTR
jgi:hypothetical protein